VARDDLTGQRTDQAEPPVVVVSRAGEVREDPFGVRRIEAGRDRERAAATVAGIEGVEIELMDLLNPASIDALAELPPPRQSNPRSRAGSQRVENRPLII
jgi:hypothetical protein